MNNQIIPFVHFCSHYEAIHNLKYATEKVGVNYCPKVPFLSTIPEEADLSTCEQQYQKRNEYFDRKRRETVDADIAEMAVIKGFQKYFEKYISMKMCSFFVDNFFIVKQITMYMKEI